MNRRDVISEVTSHRVFWRTIVSGWDRRVSPTVCPRVCEDQRANLRAHGVRSPAGVAAPALADGAGSGRSTTQTNLSGVTSTAAEACTRVRNSPRKRRARGVGESTLLRQGTHWPISSGAVVCGLLFTVFACASIGCFHIFGFLYRYWAPKERIAANYSFEMTCAIPCGGQSPSLPHPIPNPSPDQVSTLPQVQVWIGVLIWEPV